MADNQRPIKFVSSQPTDGVQKGNIGLRSIKGYDLEGSDYFNVKSPTDPGGKYVVYQVIDGGQAPLYYAPPNDTDLLRLFNLNLGGSNFTTVNECLSFSTGQDDLIVGSLINATGSTDVNPASIWKALGSNPGAQEKWYNMEFPDNFPQLNATKYANNSPQHCLSEWICVESNNTVRWGAPYTGTKIYEIS